MEFHVEHVIHAAPAEVAAVMFDPDQEAKWIHTTRSVERLTPGPVAVGAKVRREGGLLGQSFSWTTVITAFEPDHLLEMNIVDGPMVGVLTFEVNPTAGGSIAVMRTRNHVNAPLPGAGWAFKQRASEDLVRLAALVAQQTA